MNGMLSRWTLGLSLLLSTSCAVGGGGVDRPAVSEQEIRRLIAAYDEAWLRKDTTGVTATLAPGYIYLSSTGEPWPRARTLDLLRSPAYSLASSSRDEIQVQAYDGAAVVASRWRGTGTYEGEEIRDDQRCSLVWVPRNGRWQLALEQCTNISPSDE